MSAEWINQRPRDWVNPHEEFYERNPEVKPVVGDWDTIGIFESGASAMLAALLKWLFGPCTDHEVSTCDRVDRQRVAVVELNNRYLARYIHRKDCPQCMAELKESGK
jgi:hypothetical protein